MKKILIVFVVLALGLAFSPISGQSQMMGGYGYGPRGGGGGWYCPYCGSHMGDGYGPRYQQPRTPIDEKEAVSIVARYLENTRNPNLKTGAVKSVGNAYEVEIRTKDNALVDKILVDKSTGWIRSAY